MARIIEVIYQKKHDRYVCLHYNRKSKITGFNYTTGPSTIEAITKSDENMMEILDDLISESNKELTKKQIINKTIKRAEQIMLNLTKLKP